MLLCLGMSICMLAGCGTKEVDATNDKEKSQETSNSDENELSSVKAEKYYEAYREFYDEFYEEHISNDTEYTIADCGGMILLDENNTPIMAICDLTAWTSVGISADIYLYEYDGKKVLEKTKKTGVLCDDNGIYLSGYNGSIGMFVTSSEGEDAMYSIEGTDFNSIPFRNGEDENEDSLIFWDEHFPDDGVWNAMFFALFTDHDGYAISGSSFDSLLDQLAEKKPKTQLQLKIAYADFFAKEGTYTEPNFDYTVDGRCYTYSYTEQTLYLYKELAGHTTGDIPSEIEDLAVVVSEDYFSNTLREMSLEDITGFELIDDLLCIDTRTGVHLEVPTTEADQAPALPSSSKYEEESAAEAVSEDAQSEEESVEYVECSWEIRVDSTHEKYCSSADEIKQYIEAGVASDIDFSYNGYLQKVTLYIENADDYYSLKTDEEWKKLYLEAFDNGTIDTADIAAWSLADISGDGVPELYIEYQWSAQNPLYYIIDHEVKRIEDAYERYYGYGSKIMGYSEYNWGHGEWIYEFKTETGAYECIKKCDYDDAEGTYSYYDGSNSVDLSEEEHNSWFDTSSASLIEGTETDDIVTGIQNY